MKIVACGNINNKTTILEYKYDKNNSGLAYSIPADKSDEFVHKYNKQNSVFAKVCSVATLSGAIGGVIFSRKNSGIIKTLFRAMTGAMIAFFISSLGAYLFNDRLMDKYNVKRYPEV